MGKATRDLMKEHESILYVLELLEKMLYGSTKSGKDKALYLKELVYFLKIFADRCHHGKEENILFPELAAQGILEEGGPIGVMLKEHQQGREYIAIMDRSLESGQTEAFATAAKQYRDLLKQHIDKENHVLFVMADKLLDDPAQDGLFEKFEEHEEKVIGHGIHESLHGMIEQWAKEFDA